MRQTRIAARISQLLAVLAALAVTLVVYVGSTGPPRAQGAIGPTATVAAATIYSRDAPTTSTTTAGNVRGARLHSLAPSTQVHHLLTPAQAFVLAAKTAPGVAASSPAPGVVAQASTWLGHAGRVITNSAGDKIFLSANGLRRIRVDINRPYPHSSPHAHVEELVDGKWIRSGPLYPRDVSPG